MSECAYDAMNGIFKTWEKHHTLASQVLIL